MTGTTTTALETRQRQTMRMLRDYVDRLPVTAAVSRCVRALPPGSSRVPDELQRLSSLDPTLAVRMLYLANHTFLGVHGMPVTLGSVLTRVGAERIVLGLRELHGAAVFAPTGTEVEELWTHSAQVARAARYFALQLPELGVTGDEAYLSGLIHDLGRFAMLVATPAKHAAIADREWQDGDGLLSAEQEVLGFTHAMLGWLACRTWNFPEQLALVNRFHHQWRTASEHGMSRHSLALIQLVGLADEMSFAWGGTNATLQAMEANLRAGEASLAGTGSEGRLGTVEVVAELFRAATVDASRVLIVPAVD